MQKITTTLLLALCFYGNVNTSTLGKSDHPPKPVTVPPLPVTVAAFQPAVVPPAPKKVTAQQDTAKVVATITKKASHTQKKPKKKHREHHSTITDSNLANISIVALLDSIAQLESSTTGDWKANNHNIYIGRYQIGAHVLTGQGYSRPRARSIFRQFAKNPHVFPAQEQEATVRVWMGLVEEEMQQDIDKYIGRRVNGIVVTKAGILAASHRVGTVGVKSWLRRGRCRYTSRVDLTMRRYAQTQMVESFKTERTALLYQKSQES